MRSLDRKLGAICRAVAVKVAEGQHREAKLERAEAPEAEGVWPSAVLGQRGGGRESGRCRRQPALRPGPSFTDRTGQHVPPPPCGP